MLLMVRVRLVSSNAVAPMSPSVISYMCHKYKMPTMWVFKKNKHPCGRESGTGLSVRTNFLINLIHAVARYFVGGITKITQI